MKKYRWNKICFFLLLIGLIVTSCWMETVSAKVADDHFYDGTYIYGTYFKKIKNGVSYYETARFLNRSDGQFAYCIQPFVAFVNGKLQTAYQQDYAIVTHMTEEQWKRVSLLAYYGYQYQNHTDEKWYAITQLLIWKTVDSTSDMFFTSTLNGNRISLYENEIAELEQLVADHNKVPNFEKQNYTLSIGQAITLDDRNGILSQFEVIGDSNVSVYKNGNQLHITANHLGHSSIQLSKNDTRYTMPPIVYVDSAGQDLLVVGSYEPVEYKIDVNVVGGKIRITKVDSENHTTTAQGEASLIGAIYHVLDANHNLVSTLTIGNDYTATTDYLPYGEYTIQEVTSSTGYQLDSTIYSATVNSESTVDITVKEEVVKGRIQITKVDSETNLCKGRGEATLIGAQYGIYDSQNHLVETLVIGENCQATSTLLPYGNYSIKELSSSKGYHLNEEVYSQFISENKVYSLIAKEDVIENKFQIYKFYGNEDTGVIYIEEGAIFNILNEKQEIVATIETNANGYAEIELPYGNYTIQQIKGVTGYQYIYPITIHVNEQTNPIQSYHLKDGSIAVRLKLVKVDSETKQPILASGVQFKIRDKKTNAYVCQTTDHVICEFETNEEGIMITPLPLSSGNYLIEEVRAPHGYLFAGQPLEFSIQEDSEIVQDGLYGPIMELVFENQPVKGKIEIYKYGEEVVIQENTYSYKPCKLMGVQFDLYDEKGSLVVTLITDQNGYAMVDHLPLGTYTLKEHSSVEQHLVDQKEYVFVLEYLDAYTPIVSETATFYNYLPKGELQFLKIDADTQEVISNTEIEIYTKSGDCVYHGTTDSAGKIVVSDLFLGDFYIVEVKSKDGYRLLKDNLYFKIPANNEIVNVIMKNEKIKGTLSFLKVDQLTGIPLENTKIEIYTMDGILVDSGVTNENGEILFENLEYGNYYIIEKEAPDGYQVKLDKIYFDIQEDNEIVRITMENEKIGKVLGVEQIVEVPDTAMEQYSGIVSLLFVIFGIGFFIYGKIQ